MFLARHVSAVIKFVMVKLISRLKKYLSQKLSYSIQVNPIQSNLVQSTYFQESVIPTYAFAVILVKAVLANARNSTLTN